MPDSNQINAARQARDSLKGEFEHCAWFRGIGIVPVNNGLGVRLNVASQDAVEEELPKERGGVPIEVVVMDAYRPRD